MKCLECGKELRQISYKHLQACSGITPTEYKKKHSVLYLADENVRQTMARPQEKNGRWKGGKSTEISYCKCGMVKDIRADGCMKCRDFTNANNPFFGKTHTNEFKEKQRYNSINRNAIKAVRKNPPSSKNLSRGRRIWWSTKCEDERTELLQKFILSGQKSCKKNKKTKIETLIEPVIKELAVSKYVCNFQLSRYNVDFLIDDKFIIECFGDYWHCNPKIYQPTYYNKSLKLTAAQKWQSDFKKIQTLKNSGYKVLVLWESDIKECLDNITNVITNFLLED